MANSVSNSSRTRASSLLATAFLVMVCCQIVTSAPIDNSHLNAIQEFFERIVGQQEQNKFTHQMERKGGRAPALRLRFGRRSDPLWSKLTSMQSIEDNMDERMPQYS